ncbi:DUF6933 domain-containing protein [Psychrobacillus soli]|uniref:DUF6933 domain-containing protein n=1 Tax=Psychrobacillus soli TaxID=1543965 RepID=A0A544SHI6_9BACI|nr:hypothetical protein [Psychrobacillus soli]TQR04656.1 hypothetical protein FG383_20315 [Psychrobacillus soli]
MIIQCTKKLLYQLKKNPETVNVEKPLTSWHANLIIVNRRKTVVLVNDKNRYVIVLHGLKANEFKNMDEIILQSIRNTFEQESIKNDVIEQFIDSSKNITYSNTKNRTLVSRMNKACETLCFLERLIDNDTIYQTALSRKISRLLVGDGKKEYIYPNQEMYKDLKAFAGISIFQSNVDG